ncbi:MAG: OmpH family outer membrane protein [Nitrospirota bacterium]|nr:OmpH family outer membrane protein [Nitrospirota bacterium]MDE3244200.1 OmpH family outer membrane protein [Nitrospirota bacterium]
MKQHRGIRFGPCLALALLGLVGCGTAGTVPSATKIGVVEFQKVFSDTTFGKKTLESLNAFIKNREALVDLEEKELKRLQEDFTKQASVLSEAAKREREEQFRRRATEFQQKAGELNREVQEKQKEVQENFRDKSDQAVAKVAQQMGLLVVLEKGRGLPVPYSDASLDITAKVIEEMNKTTP